MGPYLRRMSKQFSVGYAACRALILAAGALLFVPTIAHAQSPAALCTIVAKGTVSKISVLSGSPPVGVAVGDVFETVVTYPLTLQPQREYFPTGIPNTAYSFFEQYTWNVSSSAPPALEITVRDKHVSASAAGLALSNFTLHSLPMTQVALYNDNLGAVPFGGTQSRFFMGAALDLHSQVPISSLPTETSALAPFLANNARTPLEMRFDIYVNGGLSVAVASRVLTVDVGCEFKITTETLPSARSLEPYGPVQLQASGGAPPYTWSVSGLPPLLPGVPAGGLSSAFDLVRTGPFSGSFYSPGSLPSQPGLYDLTFTVSDSRGQTAKPKTIPLRVEPAPLRYLHRYYNIDKEVSDHLYTNDFQEMWCGRDGWFYEGTIGLLAPTGGPGRAQVFGFWSSREGVHLYTTDPTSVPPDRGYVAQGSLGYIFTTQVPGTIPLYHLYSANERDNLYTTDPNEHPVSYSFQGTLGFVIAPPPYDSGCGDLHDERVRHAIAHSFVRGKVIAELTPPTLLDQIVEESMLYAVGTRARFPTEPILRDAEYFLIGFREAFHANREKLIAYENLLLLYDLAKRVANGLQLENELHALLQTLKMAGPEPNSPPGGLVWFAKGVLAGVAGGIGGRLPADPLVPLPDQPNSFSRSIYFSVDDSGMNTPVYIDPAFNTRVQWTIESSDDTRFKSIVVPTGTVPPGASLRLVINGHSYALTEDQPFEFLRDADLANVSSFYVDAAGVASSEARDYILGVTFTAPSAFVWIRQTTLVSLSVPSPVTITANGSAGAVFTYSAAGMSSSAGAVTVSCTHPSGTRLPIGVTVITCSAVDAAGNVAAGQFAVTVVPRPGSQLHAIGDLPGGPPVSMLRDATKVGGVIYAVGASAANNQTLCVGFNNPVGCVSQYGADTAVLWSWDGAVASMTSLPNLLSPATPTNLVIASALSRDARHLASQARSSATNAGQTVAARVTRDGLATLNLTAAPFPALAAPSGAAFAVSDDGSVLYGTAGAPARTYRFDVNASSSVQIPLLLGSHTGNVPAVRGASLDGTVMVGTSFVAPQPGTDPRAFRYVHGDPVGTVSAIPLLPGGSWNRAIAVSADGNLVLVTGDSPHLPNGEAYVYDALTKTVSPLGSPNTPWAFVSGGITADGSVIVATFASTTRLGRHAYIRNRHGWFHLTTALAALGIDFASDSWAIEGMQVNGISPDGTLVYGQGLRNDNTEGFVAEIPAGYLAEFIVPSSPPTETSIIGVWSNGGPGAFLFTGDGAYFHVDASHGVVPLSEYTSGFERGPYHWTPSTGVLALAIVQDTNGTVGFSGGNGLLGITAVVTGDTISLAGGELVATRVKGGPGSIVGGWIAGDPRVDDASSLLVLFADGTWVLALDGSRDAFPSGRDGIEAGTYAWNAGVFTYAVTLDTNGAWGFANGAGGGSLALRLSADGLRLEIPGHPIPFMRIVDPLAVLPAFPGLPPLVDGTAETQFSFLIPTANTLTVSASGLPAGLAIDPATGTISGVPSTVGLFPVTLTATNSFGSVAEANVTFGIKTTVVVPLGQNVMTTPQVPDGTPKMTLTFDTVASSPLMATIALLDPQIAVLAPPPAGFSVVLGAGGQPLYYDIHTSRSSGPATLCFSYAGVALGGQTPRIFHYEDGRWIDITTVVDDATRTVCGATTTFSPVALFKGDAKFASAKGFYAPVRPGTDYVNTAKAGSTIPLKFNVTLNGVQKTTTTGLLFGVAPLSTSACSVSPEDQVDSVALGETNLRYDEQAGFFIQNWKLPAQPACVLVRITYSDAAQQNVVVLRAMFSLK